MFHNIPESIAKRMHYLEGIDKKDRIDGTPREKRLRQIPPETGRFVALLAAMAPNGQFLEIGTSAGYSTLWLALVCRELGRKIRTFEISEEKARQAEETFTLADVIKEVELIRGDARDYIDSFKNISFCFLDAEKEAYSDFYEKIIPKMIKGGILVADNVISHREILESMLNKAANDTRVDSLIVPIGKGELVCRKL
jgi:predicted O-methyltransferase YrrM